MTIFEEIDKTYEKLDKIKGKLEYIEIKASSPRSSVFSDTPKGRGNAGNPLEEYMIKQEELTEKKEALEARLQNQWAQAVHQMDGAKIDKQTKVMMYYRFIKRMQWKKCAQALDRRYENCNWNVNKCFRKYREVLCRIRKIVKDHQTKM